MVELGYRFQDYLLETLDRVSPGVPKRVTYRSGQGESECGDIVLEYPEDLIIVEAKATRLKYAVTLSGSVTEFIDELEKKSILHAARQLDKQIEMLIGGRVPGFGVERFKRVWPVVVLLEECADIPPLRSDIRELCAKEGLLLQGVCMPLEVLTSFDVENLENLQGSARLVDLLKEKTASFDTSIVSWSNFMHYRGQIEVVDCDWVIETGKRINRERMVRLFGEEEVARNEGVALI